MISSFIPFICIAPSPVIAIATRSGYANFAAMAYGTAEPIVASPPESDHFIPRRIVRCRADQFVEVPASALRTQFAGSRASSATKTSSGLIPSIPAISARRSSTRSACSRFFGDRLAPGRVGLAPQQREQCLQRFARGALKVHFGRIADAEPRGVDVDLHAARLAFLRQELRVRIVRPDHQQRVARGHHVARGEGPEQTDRPGYPRQIVGEHRFPEQRLRAAGLQQVGDLDELLLRAERAGTDQHRDLLARVQHLGCAAQIVVVRDHPPERETGARSVEVHHVRRMFDRFLFLQIFREDQRRHGARTERRADRAVDAVTDLRRVHQRDDVFARDVLVQALQIDLLLVLTADRGRRRVPHQRQDRRMIVLGVVEPVQQVDGARPGRR